MIKRLALFFLLACSFAAAQTTSFTANLKDLVGNIPGAYVELSLKNCAGSGTTPTVPHVNGVGVIVFPVQLYPNVSTGVVSGNPYDETQIVCGSSAGVGYYHIAIYQGDATRSLVKKLLFADDFDVQGTTFNLNSATPRSGSVITPPVATAVLTNPAGNQTIVQPGGSTLIVTGNFSVSGTASFGTFSPTKVAMVEGTAPAGIALSDILYADSTAHRFKVIDNNGTATTPALFTDTLGVFAATTSAQLAGVISDETGSGAAVFATSPALVAPTAGKINNIIFVDGTTYPVSQTGIQSAITDACALNGGVRGGTTVYLPLGNVAVTNITGQQFLVTCPITIIGPGPSLLWFVVGNSVPNTVPFMRFKPAAADQGWYQVKGGFRITSAGAHGGDAFFLDSTTAGVNHFRLENTEIDGLDNAAYCVNMTAGATDQFFFGHIINNSFNCGIKMNTSSTADSWLIEHNSFGAVSGNTLPCIDASTETGSAHITAFNNNGGCAGGFFISHGTTECKVIYNQIEQPLTSTEANSAIIDLLGDTYAIDGCEIVGNNINAHTFVTNNIRLGTASNTIIRGNVISVKATTGVGIVLTASSSGTKIDGTNEFAGVGGGAVALTNASGANPFNISLPTSTGTLPATISNDTVGGVLITPNAGSTVAWQFNNTGPLQSPKGAGLLLLGATSGNTQVLAAPVAGGVATYPNQTGTVDVSVGAIDLTAQTAAQATTTLFAVPSTGAGQYVFLWDAKVTSVGTTSTLGPMTLTWTDPDGVVLTSVVSATQAGGGVVVTGVTTNTTSTFLIGTPLLINVKASTNVQVAFAYASTGTAMQYNLHEKLVAF